MAGEHGAQNQRRLEKLRAQAFAERILERYPIKKGRRSASETKLSGVDFLQRWMRTPNPMLGDAVPIEMMRAGLGNHVALFIDSAFTAETKVMTTVTRKRDWRMWIIFCDGVGPIDTLAWNSRRVALSYWRRHYPDLSNYRIKRVRVVLDSEANRGVK